MSVRVLVLAYPLRALKPVAGMVLYNSLLLTLPSVDNPLRDLIIIYNSGRFRMAGRGSLSGLMPYGNANDVVLEMVRSTI